MKRATFPYRRATAVYVLALSLVGVAVVVGYLLVYQLSQRTSEDAIVANDAGRQRMLAQRIARLASGLRGNLSAPERRDRAAALEDAFQRWRRGHIAVVRGDAGSRLSSPRLGMDTPAYASLESSYLAVESATRRVLSWAAQEPGSGTAEAPKLAVLDAACDTYVVEMDDVLGAFERESKRQTERVGSTLQAIVVGALALLAAEGLLVFRPLIQSLKASYANLEDAHQSLERELEGRRAAERARDTLEGLLPICAGCKRIRDGENEWLEIEYYIEQRSDARFSHGLCEDCIRRLYPDRADAILARLSEPDDTPNS